MPGLADWAGDGRAERSDREARSLWADAHDRYAREIRFFLAARVASPDDVEDLLQDVFMCLFTQGRPPENVRAYLYTAARRCLHTYWRRQEARSAAAQSLSVRPEGMIAIVRTASLDPVHRFTMQERAQRVDRAISELTPALAEIVRWRIVEALSIDEAARRARCSTAAAKKRLGRAKQCLKRLCQDLR